MDESLPTSELLLRYIDGVATPEEKAQVELLLKSDAAVQSEYERMKISINAVQYYGIREQVARIHKEEVQHLTKATGQVVRMQTSYRRMLSVAASVIVILAGATAIYLASLSSQKVYNHAFLEYSVSATRSASSVQPIEQAFQQNNYNEVIRLAKATTPSEEEQLLVGLSYLKTNNDSLAIQQLSSINQTGGTYAQDAQFYLAMAYIKAKDYNAALPLMYAIHDNKSHLYHQHISLKDIYDVKLLKLK